MRVDRWRAGCRGRPDRGRRRACITMPGVASPDRPSRRVGALVLHERLHVPDRAGRRPRPRRRRTPTATTTAPPGSSASTASTGRVRQPPVTSRSRCSHFAYFPGTVYDGRRVAPAARAVRRLPPVRAPRDARPARRRPRSSPARSPGGSPRARCSRRTRSPRARAWFGVADAPSILLVVLAFALCTRLALRGRGGVSRRRASSSSSSRSSRCPSSGRMILHERTADEDARGRRPPCFGGVLLAGFLPVPDRRREPLSTTTRSPTAPRRTGSSATGSPGSWSSSASSRSAPTRTRSPSSRRSSGSRSTAWLVWNQIRSREIWTGRGRLRGLDLRAPLPRARAAELLSGLAAGRRDRRGAPAPRARPRRQNATAGRRRPRERSAGRRSRPGLRGHAIVSSYLRPAAAIPLELPARPAPAPSRTSTPSTSRIGRPASLSA